MIYFVLNDLSRPAGIGLDASLQFQVLILNLNGFIPFAFTWAAKKRDNFPRCCKHRLF